MFVLGFLLGTSDREPVQRVVSVGGSVSTSGGHGEIESFHVGFHEQHVQRTALVASFKASGISDFILYQDK
jgi:hypothetical protein